MKAAARHCPMLTAGAGNYLLLLGFYNSCMLVAHMLQDILPAHKQLLAQLAAPPAGMHSSVSTWYRYAAPMICHLVASCNLEQGCTKMLRTAFAMLSHKSHPS